MPQRATLCPPGDEETREKVPLWCLGLRFAVYRTITRLGLGQEAGPKAHFQLGVGLPHPGTTPLCVFIMETAAGPTFLLDWSSWALEKRPRGG